MQVSYKDSLTDLDTFDIVLNNWDADKRRFKYLDAGDSRWDPGQKLDLSMDIRNRSHIHENADAEPAIPLVAAAQQKDNNGGAAGECGNDGDRLERGHHQS